MVTIAYPPDGYVPLRTLREALVAKGLGKPSWESPFRGGGNPDEDERTLRAIEENHLLFEEALSSGQLRASAYAEGERAPHPLPAGFWQNEGTNLSLDGRVHSLSPSTEFENKLEGTLVVVEAKHAAQWLQSNGLVRGDPFFPAELLHASNVMQKRERAKRYDWPEFEKKVISLLDEEGDFSGDWNQSVVLGLMDEWCDQRWRTVPGRTSMQSHIDRARERFLAIRKRS